MRTTARKDGDHYVLDGRKLFITNGPVADLALVYAKTDPARGAYGISAFIIDTATPGFAVAQKLEKMGFRGSQTAELVFDECRVPAENLVGEENDGKRVVMSGLDLERALVAPIAVGVAERALALTLEHAKTREQFGSPIGSFQAMKHKFADMFVALESARAVCYFASATLAEDDGRRSLAASMAKAAAGDCQRLLAQEGVQSLGGIGFTWEHDMHLYVKRAKSGDAVFGTARQHRARVAALSGL
jgi:isovaleryl-CoA dehydrogenase